MRTPERAYNERMAKVSLVSIPSGMEAQYKNVLQPSDRFAVSSVRIKQLFLSRQKVKGVTEKSLLVSLAPVWAAMSSGDQAAWALAGVASGLSGWRMFVYDTCARRKAGLAGYATPNATYQALVGHIEIVSPATGLLLEQLHPLTYYVYKKVAGTKSQYNPVKVVESFGFPLQIGISWHTALVAAGANPRARFYCVVYSSYQGRTLETLVSIPFGLADGWQNASATLSTVYGPIQGYSAYIEVYNATGDLFFDNVVIKHSALNWARDPDCNNVAQEFTKQWEQIPAHWAPVAIVSGADFGSFYYS